MWRRRRLLIRGSRKLEKAKEVQVKTGQSTQVRLDQESAMRRTERMQKAKLQTRKDEDARKEGVAMSIERRKKNVEAKKAADKRLQGMEKNLLKVKTQEA